MVQRHSMLRSLSVMLLLGSPIQAIAAEAWNPDAPSDRPAAEVRPGSAAPLLIAALGGLAVGAVIASRAAQDRAQAEQTAMHHRHATLAASMTESQTCEGSTLNSPAWGPEACQPPIESRAQRFGYLELSGRRWFETLEQCSATIESEQRAALVRVVDRTTGNSIGTLCWIDGEWSVVSRGEASVETSGAPQRSGLGEARGRFGRSRLLRAERFRRHDPGVWQAPQTHEAAPRQRAGW